MAGYQPIDELREMIRGDLITAELMNAIIRAVKIVVQGDDGFVDGGGSSFRAKDRARAAFPLIAEVVDEVPAHSILGVYEGASGQTPCRALAAQCGLSGAGSLLGLFTNDKVSIPAGGKALLRPINDYDPVLVQVTGETPGVGEPCGVELDTWGVTALGCGLVCLSEPISVGGSGSGSGAQELVWAMRTPEPHLVVGEVLSAPPGWSGSGEDLALSSGTLAVLYRQGSGLELAPSPVTGSAPWILVFWARGGSGDMPSGGQVIQAGATLGVGLMFLQEGSGSGSGSVAFLGKTQGTFDVDTEDFITLYEGNFPDEAPVDPPRDLLCVNRFGCISGSGQWVIAIDVQGCDLPYLIAARCGSGSGA